jgi:hypothetical protein
MKEYLRIEFDRADRTYRFGETVAGKVLIGAPRGDQCKAVRLRRFWRTHGKGNVDKGEPTVTRLHTGPLSGEHLHEFEFEFPAPPGPFTYHGRYLNVDQYVEVQVDLPWARDPKRIEEYVLVPGKPLAPPPTLLDVPENPVEDLVPGCTAAIGSVAMVVGLIMLFSGNTMGLLILIGGGFFYLPWLKTLAEKRLGKASAYLTSLVVDPGGKAEVEVKVFPRKPVRMNRAVFELQAREVCVSGSGSSRRTHHHKVFEGTSQLAGAGTLEGGKVRLFQGFVRVPKAAPASFKGGANKIHWEAKVRLDIPSWPDWVKKIPLVVWPAEDLLGDVEEVGALPHPVEALPQPEGSESVFEAPTDDDEPLRLEPDPHVAGLPHWLASLESPVTTPPPLLDLSRGEPEALPEALSEPAEEIEPASQPEIELPTEEAPEPGEIELAVDSTDLPDAVRAIVDAKIFGGEKDLLIRDLMGKSFEFTLEVKRVDRSFGVFSDSQYRNGQMVTGTLLGSELEVAVFFPDERNDEVKGWAPGSMHAVRGEVSDWDRLRKRPQLLARG